MIVLDTNLVSENWRPHPSPAVVAWFARQGASTLFLTAPSLAELLTGVGLMPAGRRRTLLAQRIRELVDVKLGTPILPFDQDAAGAYAALVVRTRAAGRPVSLIDAQIASIAATRGFTVATRDTRPFLAAGVPVIDPWHVPHA